MRWLIAAATDNWYPTMIAAGIAAAVWALLGTGGLEAVAAIYGLTAVCCAVVRLLDLP